MQFSKVLFRLESYGAGHEEMLAAVVVILFGANNHGGKIAGGNFLTLRSMGRSQLQLISYTSVWKTIPLPVIRRNASPIIKFEGEDYQCQTQA